MRKKILSILLVNGIIAATVGIAFGVSSYLSQFNTRYGTSGTALNTCTLCHTGSPSASNVNAFGNDYAANGYNYAAIEALDSDGDGFSNLVEIQARTFPGNPASIPVASDTTPPTVTAFSVPATSNLLTVSITTFTATDNVGVTGYQVTEAATAPPAVGAGWTATAPTSYTFSTAGAKTLFAWAKDAAGNVSAGFSRSITITPTDSTPPIVTGFTIPPNANSLTVVITSLIATDNVGVAGYLLTESATAPSASAAGWTPTPPGTYRFATAGAKVLYAWAKDATGNISTGVSATVTVSLSGPGNAAAALGIYRGGSWFWDNNGNGSWEGCSVDTCFSAFGGFAQDLPVAGDWTGDGIGKAGIYREGMWYLDRNGSGGWDGCLADSCLGPFGGFAGDIPVVGDWTGDGIAKIGIYRQGMWYLDKSGNGRWDGCTVDACVGPYGGFDFDIPVVGDWTGDGITKIGIYRQGSWFLDRNANGTWDPAADIYVDYFGGMPFDKPVVGDWTGDGISKIGIFQQGAWYLDKNGNGLWDDCGVDTCVPAFGGYAGDIPITK